MFICKFSQHVFQHNKPLFLKQFSNINLSRYKPAFTLYQTQSQVFCWVPVEIFHISEFGPVFTFTCFLIPEHYASIT